MTVGDGWRNVATHHVLMVLQIDAQSLNSDVSAGSGAAVPG